MGSTIMDVDFLQGSYGGFMVARAIDWKVPNVAKLHL